jgi:hypothetical protein
VYGFQPPLTDDRDEDRDDDAKKSPELAIAEYDGRSLL